MRKRLRVRASMVGLLFLVGLVLGVVSTLDYRQEVKAQSRYCEMVEQGAWPDYRGIYEEECG